MKKEINIEKIRADAEKACKSGEFLCAEAVVHSIRQNIDPEMPKEFISAATGFAVGVGGSGCMCAGVSGAVIALGYFFGRSFPTTVTDPQSQKTLAVSYEIQENFKEKNKILCCNTLRKNKDIKDNGIPTESNEKCIEFIGDMAAKAAEIISREFGWRIIRGGYKKGEKGN